MAYEENFSLKYDYHELEKIIELEKTIKQTLEISDHNKESFIYIVCEHRKQTATSLAEIFEKNEFKSNFNKISYIVIKHKNRETKNSIHIAIHRLRSICDEISCEVYSETEKTFFGLKEIIKNYIEANFVSIEIENLNSNKPIIENKAFENIRKTKYYDALLLNLDDIKAIEGLILRDLNKSEINYKITLTPSDKQLEINPAASKISYTSISDLIEKFNLNEINNYSITIELESELINNITLEISNKDICRRLYLYGSNLTALYGKYSLLDNYLTRKQPWYWWIYNTNFLMLEIMLATFAAVSSFFQFLFLYFSSKTLAYEYLAIAIILVLAPFFITKTLPKYKIIVEKIKWYQNPTVQFFATILVAIIGILVTFFK
ncbi:MAG: hypothetical protein IKL52_05340 [Candidatus Gastranaerophilales bacterium]|nr:hypothetical protein [Candidatus Gastranaerophilales bacterium]